LTITLGNGKRIAIKERRFEAVNTILNRVINNYPGLFADPNQKQTFTTNVKAAIRTTSDTPVYSKFYQYPISIKDEVNNQIAELSRDGLIRPSRSPYNSPVWIVPKKTGLL